MAMRMLLACLVFSLLPVSAIAETEENLPDTLEDFANSMRQLFEGFADDIAPMMEDLGNRLEGMRGYHAPEMLPNGDIIIRRKSPAEDVPAPVQPNPDGSFDL